MKTTFTTFQAFIRAIQAMLLLGISLHTPLAFSQHVTILPRGITPNQSGGVPRLSNDAIMALPNPQDGDTAYDLTFHCMRLYRKDKWVKMLSDFDLINPSVIGWQIGGAKFDVAHGLAVDASGNVYVGGTFIESAQFEDTEVTGEGTNIISLFIAKYTSTGHLLWVQKIGHSPVANLLELKLDTNGNIYVTGNFYTSITFGANTFTTAGSKDIFLAKCNNNGVLQWAQQAGGTGDDDSKSLDVDNNGNLYITGDITGNVTIGGTLYITSGYGALIAKFGSDGSFKWFRKGTGFPVVKNIAVDSNGTATITGNFTATATFGSTTITSSGGTDIFLAQYDSNGNAIWAKRMGGTSDDYGVDVAVDSENNIIVTGAFRGSATFDNISLTSAGDEDVFIAQYSSAGTLKWLKSGGGVNSDTPVAIVVDGDDNIYVDGVFIKPATFGNTTLTGKGNANLFVAKYNKMGDALWAKELDEGYSGSILKMAVDTNRNLYGVAIFSSNFITDDVTFVARGSSDICVLRIKD